MICDITTPLDHFIPGGPNEGSEAILSDFTIDRRRYARRDRSVVPGRAFSHRGPNSAASRIQTAAHAYLALRLLDYPRLRNYVGSWQEWGNRNGLPIWNPE